MNLSEFEKWLCLDSISVKDVPEQGEFVYIFRKHRAQGVLYIGSTTNLRRRLFGNYISGVGGRTTQRIHAILFKDGAIKDTEVAWKEVTDHASEEKQFRAAYYKQYSQLPTWNKQF